MGLQRDYGITRRLAVQLIISRRRDRGPGQNDGPPVSADIIGIRDSPEIRAQTKRHADLRLDLEGFASLGSLRYDCNLRIPLIAVQMRP